MDLDIDADIRVARTPPAALYRDAAWFELQRARLFPKTWHANPDPSVPENPGDLSPWTLLPDCLDEPLLLARDGETLRCLSNVCTHRGALLACKPGNARGLRCPYHGRRFDLSGKLLSAPGFEATRDFPAPSDDLPELPLARFGPLAWTCLDAERPLDDVLAPVRDRTGFLGDPAEWQLDAASCRRYEVAANWALYCDNYLEGLHIPYVHPALARTLSTGEYEVTLFDGVSLQTGVASAGEPCFDLPEGHPDCGRRIAAYYFFVFPCTMLNFYPWGLSANVVLPRGPSRTAVAFASYVRDAALRDAGAGADVHAVELEDEAIVEAVQRGMQSRAYGRGRYAAHAERAVHHFHRELQRTMIDRTAEGASRAAGSPG